MLSAFAALVLAVGLVPCGAVAGAGLARDQAGAARFVAGLLGAAAGLGLAALTFFCVIALMESLARSPARPFLPLLMPLPFVLAGACGWMALDGFPKARAGRKAYSWARAWQRWSYSLRAYSRSAALPSKSRLRSPG